MILYFCNKSNLRNLIVKNVMVAELVKIVVKQKLLILWPYFY